MTSLERKIVRLLERGRPLSTYEICKRLPSNRGNVTPALWSLCRQRRVYPTANGWDVADFVVVHHIDGNPYNNDLANLLLFTRRGTRHQSLDVPRSRPAAGRKGGTQT